jgi:integrase
MAKIPGSIKKRSGSPLLWYRIRDRGREFYVQTETASEREAERNKRLYYEEAKAKITAADAAERTRSLGGVVVTFGEACDLYFERVGQHHDKGGQGAENTAWALDWLKRQLGAETRLADIDDGMVSGLVARRRGEKKVRGKTVTNEFVSATTVNRSATEPLRKVLLFARDIGKAPIQKINWKLHVLKEPKERVRELRDEEQVALFDEGLRDDYKPLVEIALMLGLRRAELIGLKWEHVDFGARLIRVRGKGDTDEPVPLLPAARDVLWGLWSDPDRHPEFVFTFVAQRTREYGGRSFVKGERYPFTAEGWKTAFRRALDDAGVKDFRMHDTRHTAATRLHREIGLVAVKEVLRHKQIETTLKYTHVNQQEKLDALQRAADKAAERQAGLRARGGQAGASRGVGGQDWGQVDAEAVQNASGSRG